VSQNNIDGSQNGVLLDAQSSGNTISMNNVLHNVIDMNNANGLGQTSIVTRLGTTIVNLAILVVYVEQLLKDLIDSRHRIVIPLFFLSILVYVFNLWESVR
jgi:hypothetical protein